MGNQHPTVGLITKLLALKFINHFARRDVAGWGDEAAIARWRDETWPAIKKGRRPRATASSS